MGDSTFWFVLMICRFRSPSACVEILPVGSAPELFWGRRGKGKNEDLEEEQEEG